MVNPDTYGTSPEHCGKVKRFYEQEIKCWDTMGAMFGTRDGSVFLRFRHGDDPKKKKLRAAPAGGGVQIENKSHIVLRDLMIRGGENCVLITGPKAAHNVVERCRLLNGAKRVRLTEGAAHNTVRNSEMTIDFYAEKCQTGAWGCAPVDGKIPCEFRLNPAVLPILQTPFRAERHVGLRRALVSGRTGQ